MGSGHTPPPKCRHCHVDMVRGTALANTLIAGTPDFIGETRGITLSFGGRGRIILVRKCPKCGHSISETST